MTPGQSQDQWELAPEQQKKFLREWNSWKHWQNELPEQAAEMLEYWRSKMIEPVEDDDNGDKPVENNDDDKRVDDKPVEDNDEKNNDKPVAKWGKTSMGAGRGNIGIHHPPFLYLAS